MGDLLFIQNAGQSPTDLSLHFTQSILPNLRILGMKGLRGDKLSQVVVNPNKCPIQPVQRAVKGQISILVGFGQCAS